MPRYCVPRHGAVAAPTLLLLLLAACQPAAAPPPPRGRDTGGDVPAAPASPALPRPAAASPSADAAATSEAGAVALASDDGVFQFGYSYPAAAAQIAPLKARFDAEAAAIRTRMTAEAADYRREFPDSKAGYSFAKQWQVVTDLPRFLSLSAEGYEYTGGAHGTPFAEGLVWDRTRGAAVVPKAFFRSDAALDAAIQRRFCAELDRQRREKRGIATAPDDMFGDCIKPSEQVLLLGSGSGRAFDRIGIIALPYAAGPYAEGSYEITLPVTPALVAAVRPEYRAAFAAR